MEIGQLTLVVLKNVGALVAAVYGVYATVMDLKEGPEGNKRLTRKGKLGIVLLIASSPARLFQWERGMEGSHRR